VEKELAKAMPVLRATGEDYIVVKYNGVSYALFVDEETLLEYQDVFADLTVCLLGDDISAVELGTIH
jgi:Holliday junction resolvasome RuvABC DNA-binding subunit